MQKSETRRFLEEQFDKYERSRPEQTAPFVSELTEEEAPADEFLCGTATLIEQLAQTKGIPVTRVDIPAQLKGALFLVSDEHGVVPADDTDAAEADAAMVTFFADGYEKLRARR